MRMAASPHVVNPCAQFGPRSCQVTQLRGTIVDLGPPEGERRTFKKQRSAVPPIEACIKNCWSAWQHHQKQTVTEEATFIKEQFLENAPRHGWWLGSCVGGTHS